MTSKTTAIRPARPRDARGIARVEVETWRDTYPTLVPHAYLVGRLDVRRAAANWAAHIAAGARHVLVAETLGTDKAVVGYATWGRSRIAAVPAFALCATARRPTDHQSPEAAPAAKVGQLYELYVSPAARERGIGRRLVREAAERMIGDGLGSMAVEVLAGNPSRWFYEALGGRLAARGHHVFGGERLPSVIYAWDDLEAFVGAYDREAP
jgi:ribosomal protein S18 acetylase RimI-like enzyme